MTPGPMSVGAALAEATARLAAAGIDEAGVDARRLLAHAMASDGGGDDPLRLVRERDEILAPAALATFDTAVQRRLAREPVSRIIGTRWFYGRRFVLTSATLDPRPDSETLVELALDIAREAGWTAPRIADIGTGSGCLLLTLLAELPAARGVGTDIQSAALEAAAANARSIGVAERATFRLGPDLEPLAADGAAWDLILSNPPYIPAGEINGLDPEVRAYDPLVALDGGETGLDRYLEMCRTVADLPFEGWLVFEIGAGQADAVTGFLLAAWPGRTVDIRTRSDLNGHVRCVAGRPRALSFG